MRIVADTNVVVSAFLWGGVPKQFLAAARAQSVTLCTSAALIAELEQRRSLSAIHHADHRPRAP